MNDQNFEVNLVFPEDVEKLYDDVAMQFARLLVKSVDLLYPDKEYDDDTYQIVMNAILQKLIPRMLKCVDELAEDLG